MHTFITSLLMGLLAGTGAAASGASDAGATDAHAVMGMWLTHDGRGVIEIDDCGNGSPCGLTRYHRPTPEAALRPVPEDRVLLLLSGFEAGQEEWEKGGILDPDSGKTYRAKLKRLSPTELQVKGCLGPICKGMVWTKADLPDALTSPGDPDQSAETLAEAAAD